MSQIQLIDGILIHLPYENKKRVRDDVGSILTTVSTLKPKLGHLIHNDGSEASLFVLEGTIPIYFQGAQYNIPMEIYLFEAYPRTAPKVYVRPTTNMIIKPNHRHADSEGVVYLPYLSEWSTNSNISDLIGVMSGVFSIEPPLFSKPASAAPVTATNRATTAGTSMYSFPGTNLNPSRTPAVTAAPVNNGAQVAPAAVYGGGGNVYNGNSSSYSVSGSSVVETYRRQSNGYAEPVATPVTTTGAAKGNVVMGTVISVANDNSGVRGGGGGGVGGQVNGPAAMGFASISATKSADASILASLSSESNNSNNNNRSHPPTPTPLDSRPLLRPRNVLEQELTEKLRRELVARCTQLKNQLDSESIEQRTLLASYNRHVDQNKQWTAMREQLARSLESLAKQHDDLRAWATEQAERGEQSLDAQVEPYDELSSDIVRLSAEQHAIDDALYYLERAVAGNKNPAVDVQGYMREVRQLSRQQFLGKMHLMKINASVAQAMAPRK